ncbi:MAG: Asp-tRNA(Asn)/Glu-tRNA(Gln) amidotransferase subunit GatA [Catalinimonas sp.]
MIPTLIRTNADWQAGAVNSEELVGDCINNIHSRSNLGAFLEVYESEALEISRRVDAKDRAAAGRLAGTVVGLKDVLCYQNHPLGASSEILQGFTSQFTGTAVGRLLDEDVVVIGRQNCDEFAMGSSNENSAWGAVRNAVDPTRVPGGSSGGSAVAVQAGLCQASIGSDTGGSVRQPAAFCGVVGLKPTYGRVSRHGLAAYASSFDCISFLTQTVADAALLLEITAGADGCDSTASRRPTEPYTRCLDKPVTGKVAVLDEGLNNEAVAPDIRWALRERVKWIRSEGFEVETVGFPLLEHTLPTYYILTTAEASANLARYDGIRFGHRAEGVQDLAALYRQTRREGFGAEVKRRIMLGTFVLSAGYYDAYYTRAQRVRRLVSRAVRQLFETYDYLLLPTTPTTAFSIGECTQDPIAMYLADLFTVPASLAGVPAISVPSGWDRRGLPIGLQLVAGPYREAQLLAFAQYLEHNRLQ